MTEWLSYESFRARYPDTGLTETQYTIAARDAIALIHEHTHWRSALDQTEETEAALLTCEAQLIRLAEETGIGSWDGVTSVNNHGYTESYASGQDQQQYLVRQQRQIIDRSLSAPVTRWMLYEGGVYHPPRRR